MIVPLAAFDRKGHRIGYGAAYYDMTINRLRGQKPVIAIGIAYAAQEVAEVPVAAHDARLDLVLTERDVIDAAGVTCASFSSATSWGGAAGNALLDRLPKLIADWKLDFVVVNGENAAGGFGITEPIYNEFVDAGADAITLGNHAWDQREALVFIERAPRLIRPLNYPPGTPGRGTAMIDTKNGKRVLVMNAMGRIFMDALDDPFAAVERELSACALSAPPTPSSSTCIARRPARSRGWVILRRPRQPRGRHAHPCANGGPSHSPVGTAFMSDVGMTGDYQSVIGMDKDEPLGRFLRKIPPGKFEPASGPATLWRSRSRPTTRRGSPCGSARCGSAARWKRRGRRSGPEKGQN